MKAILMSLGLANQILLSSMLLPLTLIFLWNSRAHAQITSDGSLTTNISQNGNHFTITNGSAAGTNLFHSFSKFSVPTGGSATFDLTNTPNITNIFSRVTGGSVSHIDGLIHIIKHNNAVSLFLLNPHGIVFGSGSQASLNISGSFVGTTADSIKLNQQVMSDRTWSVFVTSLLTESQVKRQHKHPNHNIIPSKLLPGIVTPKEK